MGIEKVGAVFHEYCSQNKFLKVLLPINLPLLFIMAGLRVFQNFVNLGSGVGVVVYVGFILGVLLTFAKAEYQMLSIGIGILCFDYVYGFVHTLFRFHRLNWSSILYLLMWGLFAYMAYKKSLRLNR